VFDWSGFLNVANRLLTLAPDEGSQRTAISRAYYAAYHAASAFVRASGQLRQGHTHRRVWSALANGGDPALSEIGRRGDQLRQIRIIADYRDDAPDELPTIARDTVDEARSLVEAIHRLG